MIIDYILSHQLEFWLVFGFAMLSIEVVTGFSSGIFLFAGLGALMTGGLIHFSVLPETWIAGIASTGICSGLITLLLWNPLKKLQDDSPIVKDNSSDLVGHEFILDSDITVNQPGSTSYSGITWKVELDQNSAIDNIKAGQRVSVSSVEVGVFKVILSVK